ncbi:hypothetical protein L6R52_03055 [Myxococcota bacterium]|nr:hypothetical protein [Myxococcota bacterium]
MSDVELQILIASLTGAALFFGGGWLLARRERAEPVRSDRSARELAKVTARQAEAVATAALLRRELEQERQRVAEAELASRSTREATARELTIARAERDGARREATTLRTERETLGRELGALRIELGHQAQELGVLRVERETFARELGALRVEHGHLDRELGTLRVVHGHLGEELAALRVEHGQLDRELGTLRAVHARLVEEAASLRADRAALERALEVLHVEQHEVEAHLAEGVDGELQAALVELGTARARLAELDRVHEENVQLRSLAADLALMRSEVERLERTNAELRARLFVEEAVHGSLRPSAPVMPLDHTLGALAKTAGVRATVVADDLGFPVAGHGSEVDALAAFTGFLVDVGDKASAMLPVGKIRCVTVTAEHDVTISVCPIQRGDLGLAVATLAIGPGPTIETLTRAATQVVDVVGLREEVS